MELVDDPLPGSHRIARTSFGPLAPVLRELVAGVSIEPAGWSRFDTVGRTLYSTDDRLTSFMELLAPYRTEINGARRALQKDADAMGVPLDAYWTMVVADWDQAGTMRARWLPKVWRDGRAIYRLNYPPGWWVDITSTRTLAALSDHLDSELTELGVTGGLTVGHVTSDARAITTLLAGWLRDTVTLFDGTQPLGVRFISKHGHPTGGTGTCWAYWMRATDAGLNEPIDITDEIAIAEGDVDLKKAQAFCKIQTR
ncbi:hypothetical protein E3O06_07415 [Cryobacterium glaciale]|uniref:RES domain-containing protein n=1 Tax=Cryobacterium glaciale TaxID=1259145 RepID=A0A4R8UYJ3_9MICO|nr:hypothetical protein [Cryobacterium glaciale]TFB74134.1 hypothetical protein E3O06_07415 [Cryobacterium glaciale]